MSKATDDRLFESFREASGGQAPDLDSLASASDTLASAISSAVQQAGGMQGGIAPEASSSAGSGSTASTGGSGGIVPIATTVLESGLGLIPLVTGLLGLFGGGSSEPPPLVKYAMPDKQYFVGADTGDGISDAGYDQMGLPRTYSATPSSAPAQGASSNPAPSGPSAAPQINVNVQAMDARSFLDYSNEIAQAVRDAMLNSNAINDVVSNL